MPGYDYGNQFNLSEKEMVEIRYYERESVEAPDVAWLNDLLGVMADARLFWEKFCEYRQYFEEADIIVEIGAGLCWASCILKRIWKHKEITATDISFGAVKKSATWERIFEVQLDGAYACRSYEIPLGDATVDLVFSFQAAHHFVRHRNTFLELKRILRKGGRVLYLHEPAAPRWAYGLAVKRLNKKRGTVPEDALVFPHISHVAQETGFAVATNFVSSTTNKDPFATVYFAILKALPVFQRILPCRLDLILTKTGSEDGD